MFELVECRYFLENIPREVNISNVHKVLQVFYTGEVSVEIKSETNVLLNSVRLLAKTSAQQGLDKVS